MRSISNNLAATSPAVAALSPSVAMSDGRPEDADERRWAMDAASGSLAAFDRIARAYQAPLMRFLNRRMANPADAEDVLQETFVCAFRKIGKYDPRWRLSGWLFAIAVRQAATHHRRLRIADGAPVYDRASDDPGPDAMAVVQDEHRNLWAIARRNLRPDQFDVLWLYYVEQLPMPDLARALGRSRLTTKVLLHRARQRLAKYLSDV
ncbi:MAG TPA: sigma-70 family RNA polymerase sigma factor [Tepidisphaeraceae bacterium]|nr:sigma-70 family RNA polymerase sigma factor [Tepidisphaeraceae bacterium]